MRIMALGIASVAFVIASQGYAQTACVVTDFEAASPAQVSQAQQLAFASFVNEANYDKIKQDQSRAGGYEVIAGSTDYTNLRERIQQRAMSPNIPNFNDDRDGWAESALDEAGLQAYEMCLKTAGGFFTTLSTLDETTTKLSVDWYPGAAGTLARPTIAASKNIENVEGLTYTLAQGAWGANETRLELRILRKDKNKPAELTLTANNHPTVKYLPPYIKTPVVAPSKKRSTLAKIFGG